MKGTTSILASWHFWAFPPGSVQTLSQRCRSCCRRCHILQISGVHIFKVHWKRRSASPGNSGITLSAQCCLHNKPDLLGLQLRIIYTRVHLGLLACSCTKIQWQTSQAFAPYINTYRMRQNSVPIHCLVTKRQNNGLEQRPGALTLLAEITKDESTLMSK